MIGGVPVDKGRTRDRKSDHARRTPTKREREILVEVCRPRAEAQGGAAAPASNAEVAIRVTPKITPERVSDIMSDLYRKYELMGTPAQNRVALVELALTHRLVEPGDFD